LFRKKLITGLNWLVKLPFVGFGIQFGFWGDHFIDTPVGSQLTPKAKKLNWELNVKKHYHLMFLIALRPFKGK